MNGINVLGVRIDGIGLEDSLLEISGAIADKKEIRIVTANPELIYNAEKDERLRNIINSADLVLPDGIGVLWAARQNGLDLKERVTGIDLTIRILEEGNKFGWRIFLLGASHGVAEKAVIQQYKRYPGVTFGCHHGYFTPEEENLVIDRIKKFSPHVLLVGLGAPRQEYWNEANQGIALVRMGVGGTIDVLAGKVKRAPKFFCDHKLEWLYRLVTNPLRLKRQAILPLYVLKVLSNKNSHKNS